MRIAYSLPELQERMGYKGWRQVNQQLLSYIVTKRSRIPLYSALNKDNENILHFPLFKTRRKDFECFHHNELLK